MRYWCVVWRAENTDRKVVPDFVVCAVCIDCATALASVLGEEEEAAGFNHNGQLVWNLLAT